MQTIAWKNGEVRIIDQTKLPRKLTFIYLQTVDQIVKAVKTMRIRGAPAIGVAAAFGCVLGASNLKKTAQELLNSRPTAVNIKWAVERMQRIARAGRGLPLARLKLLLLEEALRIAEEDIETNKRIGRYGSKLIKSGMRILTACNTGALATVDFGTVLGVIRTAHELGRRIHVYVAETRPRLQGARLTAWELKKLKIPFTLITDNMVGYFMHKGKIDLAMVGADRIARNGDAANKIGTYAVAVLAKAHGIPFYVAAPMSSIDFNTRSGRRIVIEERSPEEVIRIGKEQIAPKGIKVANPAFDITPAKYIKAIITEKGIFKPEKLSQIRKHRS
ncbi:methylthioribose-1-phosphate isomerase [candidate division WOR-1 bacterium DG_54_3]|uniref:Methylthioribose-1-phosphate isomerase n=1 Tax=candidate division WOR-1 bacterium DG_54_3 TaxID=1703775 RepID=A0A0S7Y5T3_UNCSA|nr:MAG: methylthioribose-1-phosphate isomerase [candidate division WOR-1 bacterium DG_54_3]